MIRIATVVGARPQIIKAAALSRVIREQFSDQIQEIIIHTGQHYDQEMSQIFFDELNIPAPGFYLGVGSHTHGRQTALMIEKIEEALIREKPDAVLIYGDTNSTLAGALAGSKLRIPVIHVEAGMRSFNKSMPEEINRIVSDHVSTLLFTPTPTGMMNLLREGFQTDPSPPFTIDNPVIYHCGDIMFDNSMYFLSRAEQRSTILSDLDLAEDQFLLATIHRDTNTDDPERLMAIINTLGLLSAQHTIKTIVPLHPRTASRLKRVKPEHSGINLPELLMIIPPISYTDMIILEKNARLILTDSGGVQKEAYFFRKPCIIFRSETEWAEILKQGAALLADANPEKILAAYNHFMEHPPRSFPPVFGDGQAATFICTRILNDLAKSI
jgi:UDP-GlcNAc3NAcA epimerase